MIDIDRGALACGLAGFRVYLDRDEHGPVRCIDAHREPGFVTCDFADGSAWAFTIGTTDPAEAEQLFEVVAASVGLLDVH